MKRLRSALIVHRKGTKAKALRRATIVKWSAGIFAQWSASPTLSYLLHFEQMLDLAIVKALGVMRFGRNGIFSTRFFGEQMGPDAVAALHAVRSLPFGQGDGLRLLLVGLGQRGDFTAAMFQRSSCWQSATPFLVTRYLKKRGRKKDPAGLRHGGMAVEFVRWVLQEELGRLRQRRPDLGEPTRIDFFPEGRMGAHRLRPIQFKRFRQKQGDDGGNRPSGAFRIVVHHPVAGPICLGHSCHFGLGLFVPVNEKEAAMP